MKIVLYIIAIAVVCFVTQLFFPWWCAAMVCFIAGFFIRRSGIAFIAGLALGLLWLVVAIYLDNANHSILSQKINMLLPAKALLLTTLTGCITGGMACASGAVIHQFYSSFIKKK